MTDRTRVMHERYALLAPDVIKALQKRNYEAEYCTSGAEAADRIARLIPEGAKVAWGGSVTLDQIGIKDRLRAGNYRLADRDRAKDDEEKRRLFLEAFDADVYLSSVNAMTEDGLMVNIDGTGNRIAAIAYGPKKVILVVGMNKICRGLEAALERAQCFAAPNNGVRLSLNLPCTHVGRCTDCQSPDCMCSQTVIMRRNKIPGRTHVLLIGEDLGY